MKIRPHILCNLVIDVHCSFAETLLSTATTSLVLLCSPNRNDSKIYLVSKKEKEPQKETKGFCNKSILFEDSGGKLSKKALVEKKRASNIVTILYTDNPII